MKNIPLDIFEIPQDMRNYFSHYGRHFNKKMYEFAVKNMYKQDGSKINTISKEEFNNKLNAYNIKLEHDILYDGLYILAMVQADFMGSSIIDEHHALLYVKNVVDDVDQVDGFIFNRFYADCVLKGMPIDWYEML